MFSVMKTSHIKRFIFLSLFLATMSHAQVLQLLKGWNLKGVLDSIETFTPFTQSQCFNDLYVLRNYKWQKFSLQEVYVLQKGEGFWVHVGTDCEIETAVIDDLIAPPLTPPSPPGFQSPDNFIGEDILPNSTS